MAAPVVPTSLKGVQAYVKLAADHDAKDPVISYWIRVYVMQKAMKIDGSSLEAKKFLIGLMDKLEAEKTSLGKENETVQNEVVAQAHVENYASQIFDVADKEDREGKASLKTVRLYLIACQLFEVLSVFGDVSEEVTVRNKYGKYRATLISRALKAGETPPLPENRDEDDGTIQLDDAALGPPPPPVEPMEFQSPSLPYPPALPPGFLSQVPPGAPAPAPTPPSAAPVVSSTPSIPYMDSGASSSSATGNCAQSGTPLPMDLMSKAMKHCKFAGSALNYDDVPTAIKELESALSILKTGRA